MKPSREQIIAWAREAGLANQFPTDAMIDMFKRFAELVASAGESEPVAWQFFDNGRWWNGDDRIKDYRINTEAAGYEVRDLYTHPNPATAGDVRKPMTDDQIWKDDGIMAANNFYGTTFEALRAVIRAVEAFHHITDKEQQS